MSDVKLGQLIDGEAERDCVHVALAPVVAAHGLAPGAHVGFMSDGRVGMAHMAQNRIGIVDPFLLNGVLEGQKFWLVLYPNTVTGMRHQWAHPSFGDIVAPTADSVEASRLWLLGFAAEWGFDWNEMITVAMNPHEEHWICAHNDVSLHSRVQLGEDHELFWHHMEIFKGQQFPHAHREAVIWTCSC